MSETVHYKGKLKLIGEATNELCEKLYGKTLTCQDDFIEALIYDTDNYIINNGKLYEVISKVHFDEDIFEIKKIDDETYEYDVMYYNGGCSFNEAIDTAFDNVKEK